MKTRYLKTRRLRKMVDRYGLVGLLLASAALGMWYLWNRQRIAFLVCLGLLSANFVMFNFFGTECRGKPMASRSGHILYLGYRMHPKAVPESLEQRILKTWYGDSKTPEVRALAHEIAMALEQRDAVRSVALGDRLSRFPPFPSKEGNWFVHARMGEFYLEQLGTVPAEREFRSVLAAIPPGEPNWGRSPARQTATYGLARVRALQGSYAEALKWLDRAPGENNSGCGNAHAEEAAQNYPRKVVWTLASQPSPKRIAGLEVVMWGCFTPLDTYFLAGDTSEEQTQHAALEAALTLGCLYKETGQTADAKACWTLAATKGDPQYEATQLAQSLLRDLEDKHPSMEH